MSGLKPILVPEVRLIDDLTWQDDKGKDYKVTRVDMSYAGYQIMMNEDVGFPTGLALRTAETRLRQAMSDAGFDVVGPHRPDTLAETDDNVRLPWISAYFKLPETVQHTERKSYIMSLLDGIFRAAGSHTRFDIFVGPADPTRTVYAWVKSYKGAQQLLEKDVLCIGLSAPQMKIIFPGEAGDSRTLLNAVAAAVTPNIPRARLGDSSIPPHVVAADLIYLYFGLSYSAPYMRGLDDGTAAGLIHGFNTHFAVLNSGLRSEI